MMQKLNDVRKSETRKKHIILAEQSSAPYIQEQLKERGFELERVTVESDDLSAMFSPEERLHNALVNRQEGLALLPLTSVETRFLALLKQSSMKEATRSLIESLVQTSGQLEEDAAIVGPEESHSQPPSESNATSSDAPTRKDVEQLEEDAAIVGPEESHSQPPSESDASSAAPEHPDYKAAWRKYRENEIARRVPASAASLLFAKDQLSKTDRLTRKPGGWLKQITNYQASRS